MNQAYEAVISVEINSADTDPLLSMKMLKPLTTIVRRWSDYFTQIAQRQMLRFWVGLASMTKLSYSTFTSYFNDEQESQYHFGR